MILWANNLPPHTKYKKFLLQNQQIYCTDLFFAVQLEHRISKFSLRQNFRMFHRWLAWSITASNTARVQCSVALYCWVQCTVFMLIPTCQIPCSYIWLELFTLCPYFRHYISVWWTVWGGSFCQPWCYQQVHWQETLAPHLQLWTCLAGRPLKRVLSAAADMSGLCRSSMWGNCRDKLFQHLGCAQRLCNQTLFDCVRLVTSSVVSWYVHDTVS